MDCRARGPLSSQAAVPHGKGNTKSTGCITQQLAAMSMSGGCLTLQVKALADCKQGQALYLEKVNSNAGKQLKGTCTTHQNMAKVWLQEPCK